MRPCLYEPSLGVHPSSKLALARMSILVVSIIVSNFKHASVDDDQRRCSIVTQIPGGCHEAGTNCYVLWFKKCSIWFRFNGIKLSYFQIGHAEPFFRYTCYRISRPRKMLSCEQIFCQCIALEFTPRNLIRFIWNSLFLYQPGQTNVPKTRSIAWSEIELALLMLRYIFKPHW